MGKNESKKLGKMVSIDHCELFHHLTIINHEVSDDFNITALQKASTENFPELIGYFEFYFLSKDPF